MSMYDKNHYNIVISLQLIKKKQKHELKLWDLRAQKYMILMPWIISAILLQEKTRESLGLQGDQISQSKSTLNIHLED